MPDGKALVVGSRYGLHVFDMESRQLIAKREAAEGEGIASFELLPDGMQLLTGHWGGIANLWSLPELTLVKRMSTGSLCDEFHSIPPERTRLFSWDGPRLQVWDRESGKPLAPSFDEHQGKITAIDVSGDGKRIVSGSEDGTIRIWERGARGSRKLVPGPDGPVSWVRILPGDTRLLGGVASSVRVWDLATGREIMSVLLPKTYSAHMGFTNTHYHPEHLVWVSDASQAVPGRAPALSLVDLGAAKVLRTVQAEDTLYDVIRDPGDPHIGYPSWEKAVGGWDTRDE